MRLIVIVPTPGDGGIAARVKKLLWTFVLNMAIAEDYAEPTRMPALVRRSPAVGLSGGWTRPQ
jgi:hypothetical protein